MKTLYIHYLGESKDGPIRTTRKEVRQDGADGCHTAVVCQGGRYAVACQPQRKHLSVVSRRGVVLDFFLATGQLTMVNCPRCHAAPLFVRDAPASFLEELKAHKAG